MAAIRAKLGCAQVIGLTSFISVWLFGATLASGQAPPREQGIPGKTAGEHFRNVQAMKDDPSTGLQGAMMFIAEALGVDCNYCHSNGFEKDDKVPKQIARKMIQMTRDLNKASFEGRLQVTCYTCHQGHSKPASVPQIHIPAAPHEIIPAQTGATAPGAGELFAKFEQALGGSDKLAAVHSRVMKGVVSGIPPQEMTAELRQAPGKSYLATSVPSRAYVGAFDGKQAWRELRVGARKLDIITDEFRAILECLAGVYPGDRLRPAAAQMRVIGSTSINGRDVWVVAMAQSTPERDQLYFDKESGLLLRQTVLVPGMLGSVAVELNYEDYRDSGGVRVPFKLRVERPHWDTMTFTFSTAEVNTPLADTAFEAPKP